MFIITAEETAMRWNDIAPKIEEALVRGNGLMTTHDLFMEVMKPTGQMWITESPDGEIISAGITYVVQRTGCMELVVAAGWSKGHLLLVPDNMRVWEEFGKKANCSYVTVYGRKGWSKVMHDYDIPYYTYRRKI